MSDAQKPNRFLGTMRELFLDVRLMMALIVGLVVLGAVSAAKLDARVKEKSLEAVEPKLARQNIRIEAVESVAQRAERKADEAIDVSQRGLVEVRALRQDFRDAQEGKRLTPLPPLDGGEP